MFDIKNSRDFLAKLYEDYDELAKKRDSVRLAINAALTAYHLAEWVWGDWLKTDYATWRALGIRDEEGFMAWLDAQPTFFADMQRIANGSKHFIRQVSQSTQRSAGYGQGGFGVGGYGVPSLQIEIETKWDGNKRWIEAPILIENMVIFWRDFFLKYSPYKSDMPQHGHLEEF